MLHAGANVSSVCYRLHLNKMFWPPSGDGEMAREESGCSGLTLVDIRARNLFLPILCHLRSEQLKNSS